MDNHIEKPVFKLGLTMAGAASSAAYTAGALDMLLLALESWEASDPPHHVQLAAISGTSSGGMGAALIAVVLSSISRGGEIAGNPFFNAIVKGDDCVNIQHLLMREDIKKEPNKLDSLFDTSRIETVAQKKLPFKATGHRPPYVADPLRIFIPVTNLQGVPYMIPAEGICGTDHEMSLHADHVQFLLTWNKNLKAPEGIILDANDAESPGWEQLYEVALASGAYPLALKPRRLKIKAETYEQRKWTVAMEEPSDKTCHEVIQIRPRWNKSKDDPIEFLAVDGGITNNEPFELVRRALADLPADEDGEGEKKNPCQGKEADGAYFEGEKRNPREGNKADRAVIMIDPIQESTSLKLPDRINIFGMAADIVLSLRAQAQFKVEELKLAQDLGCYSRFLIVPVRHPYGQEEAPVKYPLATAGLGGFAGFLDSELRNHDFELGRYNCKWFLRKHFILPYDTLPKGNKLFRKWDTTNKDKFDKDKFEVTRNGKKHLPIIPLVGKAFEEEVKHPKDWPQVREEQLEEICGPLGNRLDAVVPLLSGQLGIGRWGLLGVVIRLGWLMLREPVIDKLLDRVREGLRDRGQYKE